MAKNEEVTRTIDGDTFETSRRKHSVRLAGVYAPEKGQPGAAAATKHLKGLIAGKKVTVDTVGRSYGRAVANVKADGKSVNAAMKKFLQ